MKVLQSLALVLITVAGLSRHSPLQAQEPAATADALPPITFQVPPCLPLCTAEHRAALGATSAIEGAYIRAINQAHASIAFSQFTFSSRAIYGALVQAASRGVKVQGIMDRGQFKTTGAFCEASGCTPPPPSTVQRTLLVA